MKQAINTRTQEEYDALIEYGKTQALMTPTSESWRRYGIKTCVVIDLGENGMFYSPAAHWKEEGYTIISFTEFAKTIEPDYKALYLEGRALLEAIMRIKDLWVPEYPVSEKHQGEAQALYNMAAKIDQFLTKHKDGE